MLYLNENLEILSKNLSSISRTCKKISLEDSNSIVKLVSQLDEGKKGFLYPHQICRNRQSGCVAYITSLFGSRIPYSVLVFHFESLSSSSSLEANDSTLLLPQNISELIMLEYQNTKKVQDIERNLSRYIMQKQGKIFKRQFEEYCHCQKLRVNPTMIFNSLSKGKQYIQVDTSSQYEPKPKMGVPLQKAQQKIKRAQNNIKRLLQRVDKFGSQWL